MAISMNVEGFRDIEKALAALPRGTAVGVVRRAMRKELAPIASMANALWPGAQDDVFRITSRLSSSQRGDSLAPRGRSVVNLFVGANYGTGGAPHAHLLEFGTGPRAHKSGKFTGQVAPMPMLGPAWQAHRSQLLEGLGARLWEEIRATQARRAAKAAKAAAR